MAVSVNELTEKVIGAAFRVHNALGAGRAESAYANALAVELARQGLRVKREAEVPVVYEGRTVGKGRVDLLVEGRLAVEVKAAAVTGDGHASQLRGYLRSLGLGVGLLLAFGGRRVQVRRVEERPGVEGLRARWREVLSLVEREGPRKALEDSYPEKFDGEWLVVKGVELPEGLDVNVAEEALEEALEKAFGGRWDVWIREAVKRKGGGSEKPAGRSRRKGRRRRTRR